MLIPTSSSLKDCAQYCDLSTKPIILSGFLVRCTFLLFFSHLNIFLSSIYAGSAVVQPRGETVSSMQPDLIRYTYDQIISASCGYRTYNDPSSFYVKRGYLGFKLPTYISGTYISSAILSSYAGGIDSSLYLAGSDSWNSNSLTWNNQPGSIGAPIASFNNNSPRVNGRLMLDITSAVNKEYLGDGYLSMALRVEDENYQGNERGSSMTISSTPADVRVVMYIICKIDPLPDNPYSLRSDLNGDHQIDLSSNSSDKTSAEMPFRFWLNDDHDVGGQTDGDDLNNSYPDYANETINSIRDLEDFAPLNLRLPANLVSSLHTGARIVFTATGTGAITLVPISQPGFAYLYDPLYAHTLVGISSDSLYTIYGNDMANVPLDQLFASPQTGDRTLGFIFEGVSAGDMVLSGQIIDADGSVVAQTENFYLHLGKITEFYNHFTVGDSEAANALVATTATELNLNAPDSSDPNVPYILFVHGWRLHLEERRRFAETAFKRLYWAGYRGGFGLFSWPTEWIEKGFTSIIDTPGGSENYDRSELQAWKSATGLRNLIDSKLESGSQPRVHLFAHSMGNVVASEALKIGLHTPGAKLVYNYIASQAATVASAYDESVLTNNGNPFLVYPGTDIYREWPLNNYSRYFLGIRSMTFDGITSFCNPVDFALNFSEQIKSGAWRYNQTLKPDRGYGFSLDAGQYTQDDVNGQRQLIAYGVIPNSYYAFAFAAPASSLALGTEPATGGEIKQVYRLDQAPLNFGSADWEHSAEFLSAIQFQHYFWETVLSSSGLGSNTGTTGHKAFFSGEATLNNGVNYLSFAGTGNYFGYYSYLIDQNYIYHFDLGYEYVFDAADGKSGVYLYDFKSNTFFYTSPTFPFPYLYDFTLNSVLYYYPDPTNLGRYNTNGLRYFYNYTTGQIITK